jgi:hypothetical protein
MLWGWGDYKILCLSANNLIDTRRIVSLYLSLRFKWLFISVLQDPSSKQPSSSAQKPKGAKEKEESIPMEVFELLKYMYIHVQ